MFLKFIGIHDPREFGKLPDDIQAFLVAAYTEYIKKSNV
jgi:hypothetical protein